MTQGRHRRRRKECASAFSLVAFCLLQNPRPTYAQYESTAEVEAPIASANAVDPTAAGSSIDLRHRITVGEATKDVFFEVPGALVFQTGGFGSFAGLSLRGAELDQTVILFGDMPVSNPDFLLDLSLLPLAAFESVEVYRGGAPAWFTTGSIGGVVRFLPREAKENRFGAQGSWGSFSTWSGTAYAELVGDRVSGVAMMDVSGSNADFPYTDDGGTRLVFDDDVSRKRRNAQGLLASVMGRVQTEVGGGELEATFVGASQDKGEPGPGSRPALQTRRHVATGFGYLQWSRERDGALPYRVQVMLGGVLVKNEFTDLLGELATGGPKDAQDKIRSIYARAAASISPQPWLELTAIGSLSRSVNRRADALAVQPPLDSERLTPGFTAEARIHHRWKSWRFELRPSVNVQWSTAHVEKIEIQNLVENDKRHVIPNYRLGAVIAPLEWLSIRGSIATGARLATLLELFGDRSTVVANPDLEPEDTRAWDVGLTIRGCRPLVSGLLELHAFGARTEDLIRAQRTSQSTIRFENIDRAQTQGVEIAARGELTAYLRIQGALTRLFSKDTSIEKALPFRPSLQATTFVEVHTRALGKRIDDMIWQFGANHRSTLFTDRANQIELPARTWLSAAFRINFAAHFSVVAGVHDILDARGSDLLGFPVPGRRYSLNFLYNTEL